jgi:hypothetical protein
MLPRRENEMAWRKAYSGATLSTTEPHESAQTWTRAAALKRSRLTAQGMAWTLENDDYLSVTKSSVPTSQRTKLCLQMQSSLMWHPMLLMASPGTYKVKKSFISANIKVWFWNFVS